VQAKQADIWAEVEGLKTEVAAMKGQLDTLNMRVGSQGSQEVADLNERLKAVELALETQFAVDLGKGAKAAAAAPSPAPAQAANQPAQAEAAAPQDPADALYAKGLNAFKERKYDEARRDFAEFTTTFKKHALVPNAVFWQGECYYQMGDYAKAVLAYQDVIDKYKDSPKYRSAMLKQGISFYKLGKDKPGKIILQELIDKNPGTAEANRAKQFLADPKK
jgi:tol-pal system protein YbgF